jgi:hypothetical protein
MHCPLPQSGWYQNAPFAIIPRPSWPKTIGMLLQEPPVVVRSNNALGAMNPLSLLHGHLDMAGLIYANVIT